VPERHSLRLRALTSSAGVDAGGLERLEEERSKANHVASDAAVGVYDDDGKTNRSHDDKQKQVRAALEGSHSALSRETAESRKCHWLLKKSHQDVRR
jgi:hypothetical protein